MDAIVFITHPEVVIDPAVPVPRWPLSAKGRTRMETFADALAGGPVAAVWSSDEQKALDGGAILAERLAAPHRVDPRLGENGRESTGYIAPPEFWEVVAEFFAKPDESVRGWETARHAQQRIVDAVTRLDANSPPGVVLVVSHGGVGALLTAHLQGVEIGREDRPPNPAGGCYLVIGRGPLVLRGGWREVETPAAALAIWG
ncbi:histidine phosphatase family protein [Phenylobacterium sp.]|uniref:histidine phosphatase family protein n=1 Tax=Phenylobacterium sp. TaxID=1871053 RepID=UPI0025DF3A0B|nr:histidine phosphatase family protein [Phenylobacterium sp.]